jgi:uncharacterized protein
MPKPLRHTLLSGLEVRHEPDAGDGRTLIGLAVPFDVELDVSDWFDDYTEVFRRGAFAQTIRERSAPVQMFVNHKHRELPIGKAVHLEETDRGLEAEFHLSVVPEADQVLTLVGDGVMNGLSIGFEPVGAPQITKGKDRTPPADRDLVERTEVKLYEVSICSFPAYAAAGVESTRSSSGHPSITSLAAERARLHAARADALDRWGRVVRR